MLLMGFLSKIEVFFPLPLWLWVCVCVSVCVCACACVRACVHACVCWEGGLEDILGHLQQSWEFFLVACWAKWVQGGSGGVGGMEELCRWLGQFTWHWMEWRMEVGMGMERDGDEKNYVDVMGQSTTNTGQEHTWCQNKQHLGWG